MGYLSNPWIWLITAIAVYYLIKRLELNTKYNEWQQKRKYIADAEHVKKNPDFYRQRMEAMEKARQKQQVNLIFDPCNILGMDLLVKNMFCMILSTLLSCRNCCRIRMT